MPYTILKKRAVYLLFAIPLFAGCGAPQAQPPIQTPPPAPLVVSCIKWPTLNASDSSRVQEIFKATLSPDGSLTTETHEEFWSILDRYGVICEGELQQIKQVLVAASECQKLFYEDAFVSQRTGQAFKSSDRLDCENNVIKHAYPAEKADTIIKAEQELMEKIASGSPIAQLDGHPYTPERIQRDLDASIAVLERANQLFTKQPLPQATTNESKINLFRARFKNELESYLSLNKQSEPEAIVEEMKSIIADDLKNVDYDAIIKKVREAPRQAIENEYDSGTAIVTRKWSFDPNRPLVLGEKEPFGISILQETYTNDGINKLETPEYDIIVFLDLDLDGLPDSYWSGPDDSSETFTKLDRNSEEYRSFILSWNMSLIEFQYNFLDR